MASDLDIPCLVCDTLRSEHGDKTISSLLMGHSQP